MSIAEGIRSFTKENPQYRLYEGYSGRGMFGRKCLGVAIPSGYSYMDMLIKLAKKLGVSMGTVWNYIDKALDELLAMCMGIPAAVERNDCTTYVRKIIDGSRLFESMSGEYIFELFPAHKGVVAQSQKHTDRILNCFHIALNEYLEYCRDMTVAIDADIRKADVLMDCLAGASCGSIAEKYRCSEETVYSDIRENERKLAAMLFKTG